MKKIRNVWIENPFAAFEAEHLRKPGLQVPAAYGATKDLTDAAGEVVRDGNGKPIKVADQVDANTYHLIRDLACRYITALPIDERTQRYKVERGDSKEAKRLVKQLAKQKADATVIELEESTHEWIVKLVEERGVALNLYPALADSVIEAIKDVVKDEEAK